MKKALILWGGWDGHEPEQVSDRFKTMLENEGFDVNRTDKIEQLEDEKYLKSLDLFVPVITMAQIKKEQLNPLTEAIASGVGIAGCHGGMGDSFRNETDYHFMVGGQWIAHPGGDGVKHTINIKKNSSSPIIDSIDDFEVSTEQYYMHIDPCINVLATTRYPVINGYHVTNGAVDVPMIWTKMWGYGRVFYSALGHHNDIFDIYEIRETMLRGMLWAAEGKKIALERGLDYTKFKNNDIVS